MDKKTEQQILDIWYSRNPVHEINADTGKDMFYDTMILCMEEYHALRSREQQEHINFLNAQIQDFSKVINGQTETLILRDSTIQEKQQRIEELETLSESRKALLSRVLYWDNGELPENAIREIQAALSGELPEVKEDKAFGQLKVDYDNLQSRSDQQEERIKELKDERDSLSQMVLEMVGESEEQIMKEFLEFKLNRKA